MGVYGFGFWAPQIIKSSERSATSRSGLRSSFLYAFATRGDVSLGPTFGSHGRADLASRHTQLRWQRLDFCIGGFADNLYLAIAAFTLGAVGIYSSLPLFWTLPTAILTGTAAAGGIALINSIGNLSGFVGP